MYGGKKKECECKVGKERLKSRRICRSKEGRKEKYVEKGMKEEGKDNSME